MWRSRNGKRVVIVTLCVGVKCPATSTRLSTHRHTALTKKSGRSLMDRDWGGWLPSWKHTGNPFSFLRAFVAASSSLRAVLL